MVLHPLSSDPVNGVVRAHHQLFGIEAVHGRLARTGASALVLTAGILLEQAAPCSAAFELWPRQIRLLSFSFLLSMVYGGIGAPVGLRLILYPY